MMNSGYKPYFDPEIESLIERIHPPRVCIDNETCQDCSLVKVDSANKHGILLDMVQVLTDLGLIISKSYICSDGGWFMDVFHVTDQYGNRITDEHLIHYIQQALCVGKKPKAKAKAKEMQTYLGNEVGPIHTPIDQFNTLEVTATDRPGLLSEVSAVLVELGFHVVSATAWTHNTRVACIMYMEDESQQGAVRDLVRLGHAEEQLEHVVEAHHFMGERRGVRLSAPELGRIHTERRLHQLMYADRDYDLCYCGDDSKSLRSCSNCCGAQVSIEKCNERGYSVVNLTSRDRPKLLFDTVCTLTDMKYVVFHAAVSSQGSRAVQEYYIRHMDGCILDTEGEKQRVMKCLVASIERRVSHGLRLDLCTKNRVGLLSDVTRVFRENGMSLSRADIGTRGDEAIGAFYVTDLSGNDVDPKTVELVRNEIGATVLNVNKSSVWDTRRYSSSSNNKRILEERTAKSSFGLGSLLWAQLERLSSNFGPIKS